MLATAATSEWLESSAEIFDWVGMLLSSGLDERKDKVKNLRELLDEFRSSH